MLVVINWYRPFEPNCSEKLKDMTELLKTKEKSIIKWTRNLEDAKNSILEDIKNNSRLEFPNFNEKFQLFCDASEIATGVVLQQKEGIIGYFSHKLSGSELNYTIMEKELYSIVLALNHFKNTIQGFYVEISTDSKNLTYFNKKINSRIQRWKCILNEHNYSLKSIDGKNNIIADALSRCSYMQKIQNKKADMENTNELMLKRIFENVKNCDESDDVKKKKFIKYLHEFYGHPGITAMTYLLKEITKVKIKRKEISSVVLSCHECLRSKNSNIFKKDAFAPITSDVPFKTFSSDILGPIECIYKNITVRGYIVTITDVFSRYSKLFFKKQITGKTLVAIMNKMVRKYKKPNRVISDNGPQYISNIFKKWCEENSISHVKIPIYAPFSNGISERINARIKNHIIIYGKDKDIREILRISERTLNFC